MNSTKLENRAPYNSKGFAYIYNDEDYKNNIIKGKLNNSLLQVSHASLKNNALRGGGRRLKNRQTDFLVLSNTF